MRWSEEIYRTHEQIARIKQEQLRGAALAQQQQFSLGQALGLQNIYGQAAMGSVIDPRDVQYPNLDAEVEARTTHHKLKGKPKLTVTWDTPKSGIRKELQNETDAALKTVQAT